MFDQSRHIFKDNKHADVHKSGYSNKIHNYMELREIIDNEVNRNMFVNNKLKKVGDKITKPKIFKK
jgi:hypothetical protein